MNLSVMAGYTNVLFGPNGSGKSTLLMTIMGFSGYKVTKGRILLNGEDITNMPVSRAGQAGHRPDDAAPAEPGRRQAWEPGQGHRPRTGSTRRPGQGPGHDHLPGDGTSTSASRGGEIKRSELLQLAAQNPCLYMLDEPESGVDMVSIEKVGHKIHDLIHGHLAAPGRGSRAARRPGHHPHRPDTGLRGGGPRIRHVQRHHRLLWESAGAAGTRSGPRDTRSASAAN